MFKVYLIMTMSKEGIPNIGISSGINKNRCVDAYLKNQIILHPEDHIDYYNVNESSLGKFIFCLIVPGWKHELGGWDKEWTQYLKK